MTPNPLLSIMYEPIVRTALLEDLGRAGDITADGIVPDEQQSALVLRARQPGVVAGLDIARCAFQFVAPAIRFNAERPDGSAVVPGEIIATIEGPARGLLTGERTALNFLCHLSGVATATSRSTRGSCATGQDHKRRGGTRTNRPDPAASRGADGSRI